MEMRDFGLQKGRKGLAYAFYCCEKVWTAFWFCGLFIYIYSYKKGYKDLS